MTNRKNYNSILFLTVYLGLVLVGGSSQVFAHAASNALFELRNEIEFKEDLENKPENDEVADFFSLQSEKVIGEFLIELQNLKKQGKSKFGKQLVSECGYYFCGKENAGSFNIPEGDDSLVFSALDNLHKKLDIFFYSSQGDLPTFIGKANSNGCHEFNNKISLNKNFFKLELSFSKNSGNEASIFSEKLNSEFKKKAEIAQDSLTKQILKNTKVFSDKEFIIVITNLPRGSIDSLLKQ